MRKKLFIGVFLTAVASIIAGEYLFNRIGAQDAKKPPEEKKSDLFDVLKKDLEAKKDAPPPVVGFPLPTPPGKPSADVPTFPALPAPNDSAPTFPALTAKDLATTPPGAPKEKDGPTQFPSLPPMPKVPEAKPSDLTIPPPVVGEAKTPPTIPPVAPPVVNEKAQPTVPQTVAPPVEPKKRDLVVPQLPSEGPPPEGPPPVLGRDLPPMLPLQPVQPIVDQVAKIKDCPWSLQVEVADGQTTVIATVNKKHEFKIVCKSLDLQTGKGTLKAAGKVTITGDAFNGACENLSIPLMEDRLVLEGGAAVTIQKLTTNVSDTKPAAFELKGETLNLRISELRSAPFRQTSMRIEREPSGPVWNAAAKETSKWEFNSGGSEWSPYGKLRRIKTTDNSTGRLCLETDSGKIIAYLVTREGGSLESYLGRRVSVYGTRELEEGGQPVVRVTHIAVP